MSVRGRSQVACGGGGDEGHELQSSSRGGVPLRMKAGHSRPFNNSATDEFQSSSLSSLSAPSIHTGRWVNDWRFRDNYAR